VPSTVQASSTVPKDIQDALSRDLENWQTQLQLLLNDSTKDIQKNKIMSEKSPPNYLGEGYAIYSIYLSSSLPSNTYITSTNENLLRFTGYLFSVESAAGSIALAFTDHTSDNRKIIRLASSDNFSDNDFKLPMQKAQQLVGFNASSKLIYDEGHRTVALVTITDQGEQVAMLKDSSPLDLKQYDVLSFQELIIKVDNYEAQQIQMASSSTELLLGGGDGSPGFNDRIINVQDSLSTRSSPISINRPLSWMIVVIFIIGFVILYYFIYRKRKISRSCIKK